MRFFLEIFAFIGGIAVLFFAWLLLLLLWEQVSNTEVWRGQGQLSDRLTALENRISFLEKRPAKAKKK